jgi:hypothetical protein
MKLSNADEIRISILLALAVGEVVGFLHFYGQPSFTDFIIVSLSGILLTIPMLWIEWIQRSGISIFSVLASILFCAAFAFGWNKANLFERLAIAVIPLLIIIRAFRKLNRHIDTDQQEAFIKTIRAEDNRLGRITRNTVGLTTCILLTVGIGSGHTSALWAIPLAIPITWFAWRIIVHLFLQQQGKLDTNDPIETLTDQGGRA